MKTYSEKFETFLKVTGLNLKDKCKILAKENSKTQVTGRGKKHQVVDPIIPVFY